MVSSWTIVRLSRHCDHQMRQQDPKQPINTTEARATGSAALQHADLMARRDRF
jgi:hypothetical protein